MATEKTKDYYYSQKHESQMKTRPLETASGIPLEGQNSYEGPDKSKAGAGRGEGRPPMSRKWIEK